MGPGNHRRELEGSTEMKKKKNKRLTKEVVEQIRSILTKFYGGEHLFLNELLRPKDLKAILLNSMEGNSFIDFWVRNKVAKLDWKHIHRKVFYLK